MAIVWPGVVGEEDRGNDEGGNGDSISPLSVAFIMLQSRFVVTVFLPN